MKPFFLAAWLVLAGCQVKSPAPSTPPLQTGPAALPGVHGTGTTFQAERSAKEIPGLIVDASGNLVSLSNLNLQPGRENILRVRMSSSSLVSFPAEQITLVEYDMPKMPEMGGPFVAALAKKSDTEVEATLDVTHGGYWEIRVHRNGKEAIRVGIDVPKGKGR